MQNIHVPLPRTCLLRCLPTLRPPAPLLSPSPSGLSSSSASSWFSASSETSGQPPQESAPGFASPVSRTPRPPPPPLLDSRHPPQTLPQPRGSLCLEVAIPLHVMHCQEFTILRSKGVQLSTRKECCKVNPPLKPSIRRGLKT